MDSNVRQYPWDQNHSTWLTFYCGASKRRTTAVAVCESEIATEQHSIQHIHHRHAAHLTRLNLWRVEPFLAVNTSTSTVVYSRKHSTAVYTQQSVCLALGRRQVFPPVIFNIRSDYDNLTSFGFRFTFRFHPISSLFRSILTRRPCPRTEELKSVRYA